jgi:hypothetical protein
MMFISVAAVISSMAVNLKKKNDTSFLYISISQNDSHLLNMSSR